MNNPDYLITFSDLIHLFKKNKRRIKICAIVFASVALLYGLTKPIVYEAEGTFKEKSKSQSGLGSSLSAAFLMISDGHDSNALTILRSRMIIEELIKKQNLQGILIKNERSFPFFPLKKIKDNLLTEYALYRGLKAPILNDRENDLKIETITYNREVPKELGLKILQEDKFALADGKDVIEGAFGKPVSKEDYSFVLSRTNDKPMIHDEYLIVLLPLQSTAQLLAKGFTIEPDKNDKSLLKITYIHPDRKLAAANVNTLMACYQKYIECEHDQICKKQVGYLVERQTEMSKVLEDMMQAYADSLALDVSSTGFATSERAMDFLANSQQGLKHKLFSINLETQRLERVKNDALQDSEAFSSLENHDVINKIAAEKRVLKQQADSLNLVLRNLPSQASEFQSSFSSQLDDMEEIKKTLGESQQALASLQNNEIPHQHRYLGNHSKYIFNTWREKLISAKNNLEKDPANAERSQDWEHCKTGFTSYLANLNHFLNVYKRNIEERLSHQQAPLKEFQGINLAIAKDLYIAFNNELSNAESAAAQHEFVCDQIDDPNFEIGSLSTIINDPLSLGLITNASNLILSLKDQNNRSAKEQERLNADLAIQKGFIKTHIQQSIALLKLQQNFLKEKIQNLQSLNLSLIQEQISILENQMNEYLANTLENLNQEKLLIEKNLTELRMEMAAFPQKWAAEQLINQQMEVNKNLVEEISKLVESKNITNNLETMQSSPVDMAFPPLHPKSPRLILLAIIGALAGALIGFFWTLGKSVIKGVQASADNLQAIGQHVCGTLSRSYQEPLRKDPLLDHDLSTLRRILAYIDLSGLSKTLLLLEGKGPDYAMPLAELMSFKSVKPLILELRFEDVQEGHGHGILQYLEGKISEPAIQQFPGYDKIASGGIFRYANELIGSRRFRDLLDSLKKKYDWIIVSSSAMPNSAETETLLDFFPNAVVTVTEETLQELHNCIQRVNNGKNKIAFVITHEEHHN
jgi:tyrosine-protein kinase Etk/Wzc